MSKFSKNYKKGFDRAAAGADSPDRWYDGGGEEAATARRRGWYKGIESSKCKK